VATLNLTPGIYLSHPTPFGAPSNLTKVVDTSTGYTAFGRVLTNDSGRTVFEATLTTGDKGIFFGPNPSTQLIVKERDFTNGPKPFLSVRLGGLNNAGQIAFRAVDYSTNHDEIWRVGGL
jgi:hypothetical protein